MRGNRCRASFQRKISPVSSPNWDTVAIVGVGLIGGSLGLALRQRKLARRVIGVGRRASSLAAALDVGAVDATTTDLAEGVREASAVVVCTPVSRIAEDIVLAAAAAPPGTLLTDAGSVKQSVVQGVAELARQQSLKPGKLRFVGSHPLAGSEKSGPQYATADLFVGRMVLITPEDDTDPAITAEATALWEAVGAVVQTMPPAEHDQILAGTSHLPHVVASVLAAGIPGPWWAFSAGGLRDTTRIAAGDPELWRQIVLANREALLGRLQHFERDLAEFRAALAAGDGDRLFQLLALGKEQRDALGN
jgi:prephenate dehydrogenase